MLYRERTDNNRVFVNDANGMALQVLQGAQVHTTNLNASQTMSKAVTST